MLRQLTDSKARIAVGLVATALTAMLWPQPAHASGVTCLMNDPESGQCQLEARWEQADGGPVVVTITTGGGGILQQCQRPRKPVADAKQGDAVVDCFGGETKGWYSYRWDCYFIENEDIDPSANAGSIVYQEGTQPGSEGDLYMVRCFDEHFAMPDGWSGFHLWFLPSPPDGYGGQPDPTADLIVEAFNQLQLHGPEIGTAPPVNGAGLVGMPVWLWTEITDQTWGTPQANATAAGITVTANAEATHIEWHPGDGSTPITCDAGKPWQPGDDPLDPPCGHTYTTASRHLPDGRYEITGYTTWEVTWSVTGGPNDGIGGTVTLTPQSQTTLRINEVQVLVTAE